MPGVVFGTPPWWKDLRWAAALNKAVIGNLTSEGLRGFEYDDENQLIQITATNSWKTEFKYDGLGRRRIRKEFSWVNSAWVQSAEVRYVYDGKLVVQERDANNVSQAFYTRGSDFSKTLQGAGGIGGLLAWTQSPGVNPQHSFYHSDGGGNMTMLINANQQAVAKYLYDPFGNILVKSGPLADVNLYGFSSKEAHARSGLVYFGYRYYDPNLQRWLNRDPFGEPGSVVHRTRKVARACCGSLSDSATSSPFDSSCCGDVQSIRTPFNMGYQLGNMNSAFGRLAGVNLYAYVRSNPSNLIDPLGLESLPWGWHGPGSDYDPSSNPLDGPAPHCYYEALVAAAAGATAVYFCANEYYWPWCGAAILAYFYALSDLYVCYSRYY